ncbi:MAG: PhzF family phenazine biosynthesis protein [Pseudomonadota bacterium]|nr:PhzF family phenazine biosynthesis protein [Pseudomonadota bacterium]
MKRCAWIDAHEESRMKVLGETRYRVFGSAAFRGNPVTLFEVDMLDDRTALLQAAQRSGTIDNVFFTSIDGGPVKARFFSSTAELWLCGHGLLALSHHLHVPGVSSAREVLSPCGSWQIHADVHAPRVSMPVQRAIEITDPAHWLKQDLDCIGIEHERLYEAPNGVWIVVLRDMPDLLGIDAGTVAALPSDHGTPGALIATLRLPDSGYGFRYFAPWHGKPEDCGTGSAHCYLAPLMIGSSAPVTALQFGPEGVAEMRVSLRDDAVAVSGRVDLCS